MNRTKRNFISARVAVEATYVEVDVEFTSYFSVYNSAEGLLLSLGHATPADGTSIDIPAGGAFALPTGVVGPVFVKSLTGTATTAHIVGA